MLRSILSVVAGLMVAGMVVFALEVAGHMFFPPPPGLDLHDPEQLQAMIDKLPLGALISVLVAWGVGSLVGACVAALLTGRAYVRQALIVGGAITLLGCLPMLMIPHPLWFVAAALVILPTASWLGAQLARVIRRPRPPSSPQPYDMRDKNMAC